MADKRTEPDFTPLVDLDGVCVDFVAGFKKNWNAAHPDRPITTDPTTHGLEIAYSNFGSETEIEEIYHAKDFFLDLEPIPGAIEALKQMVACGLYPVICSSPTRATTSFSEKADWIEIHLGKEWLKRLILTKDKTMVHGDYLIDDNPVITGVFDPSWEHIIFDAAYNRDEEETDKRFRITWETWPSLLLYHSGSR